jgi:hypothetical protein
LLQEAVPNKTGPQTRIAIQQAGIAHRAAKNRLIAVVAWSCAFAIVVALFLDAMRVIEIPVVHSAVISVRQAVRPQTEPTQPWTNMLTEAERVAIRKALLEGNQVEVERVRHQAKQRAKERGLNIDLSDQVTNSMRNDTEPTRRGETTGAEAVATGDALEMRALMNRDEKAQAKIEIKPTLPELRETSREVGGLTGEQIAKVVGDNQGGIEYCATQETKRGIKLPPKLNVALTIATHGKVTDAKISDPDNRDSPLGKCLMGKARIWRFPQFSGEPMEVEIPLKFATVN